MNFMTASIFFSYLQAIIELAANILIIACAISYLRNKK